MNGNALEELIDSLRCLPGVGPKSAQRIAYHLLERDRDGAQRVARGLLDAVERIGHCESCRNFSETTICAMCSNERRNNGLICVVESPANVNAIEETAEFHGRYFVLMGHLSPLDGIGPQELGLEILENKCREGNITELILAMGATVEGEATAHYIADMASQYQIKASRIAYGVPVGGDLEYVDGSTLTHALSSRRVL